MQKLLTVRPTASRAAVLLLFGVAVGYPSAQILGHAMWGTGPGPTFTLMALCAFFAAGAAFLASIVCFVTISLQTVSSSVSAPSSDNPPMPMALQFVVLAIIVLGFAHLTDRTGGSFGRQYWQFTMFPYLLPRIPMVVGLVLTRKRASPVGLALIFVAVAAETTISLSSRFSGLFVGDIWIDLIYVARLFTGNIWLDLYCLLALASLAYIGWMWLRFRQLVPSLSVFASVVVALIAYVWVAKVTVLLAFRLWR